MVFAPALKELYFAAKTIGSFKVKNVTDLRSLKENSKLNLKDLKTPEKYTLITSRSHLDFETKKFINKMKKKYDNIILKSFGSSIKICRVADGSASCYPRFGPTMEWDTAAAHTIAEFAGCKVVDYIKKTDLIYNKSNLLNPNFIVFKI